MNLFMKCGRYNLLSFSHSLFFFLVLAILTIFWFPKSVEAVCVNTTTFDPNTKTTLLDLGGIDLGRAINIPPWVSPAPFDGATWNPQDVCTPVSATSIVTILPTSYTFQSNNATKQSYLTRGNYEFNTVFPWPNGSPYPPVPICKPGNACQGLSSLNEATCNGHNCRWNADEINGSFNASLNPWPYNVYIPEQTTNGYGLRITGPSLLSVIKDQAAKSAYSLTGQIDAEDSVINTIL